MKTNFFILILILFTNLSFGQKVLNKDYRFLNKESKVAIIPLTNELTKFNDSISNDIFKDTLSLKYLKVEELRTELNEESTDILKRIASKKYKKSDLKKYPNLNTLISISDLKNLKENLQNADLLLFPIKFNINQSIGMTFGSATFRFYDLNTGDFVHQYESSFNVNTIEDGSKQIVTALLFLEEKNYLIKQKSE
ncbi:hypothetical protein EV196_10274 [Mariniflexile fucanivorans]|uniref:Uncharacterized protein n=1 Tax=Mariniflexile fucanivorans TaxID=264023 RepID=A0A4R1RML6_9FLAO|nr:hypothetical protein [Mariniflexile fucanivorans]TCL67518.1 hypothetical protein EV196_10274 [Mariniflexile fucanivorans]